ncbi:MAG: penicillin-binding protein [Oscillospiraceae bacterium]|jgi:penicillin-binding protein 1A|nr:penicillin-binding protein [Oscillospiraceae bacterium]
MMNRANSDSRYGAHDGRRAARKKGVIASVTQFLFGRPGQKRSGLRQGGSNEVGTHDTEKAADYFSRPLGSASLSERSDPRTPSHTPASTGQPRYSGSAQNSGIQNRALNDFMRNSQSAESLAVNEIGKNDGFLPSARPSPGKTLPQSSVIGGPDGLAAPKTGTAIGPAPNPGRPVAKRMGTEITDDDLSATRYIGVKGSGVKGNAGLAAMESTGDVPLGRGRGKPKKKRRIGATVGKVALSAFLIGIITVCLVVGAFAVYVFGFVNAKFEFDLNTVRLDGTTVLYKTYLDGSKQELASLHGQENRIWVGIDKIPLNFQNAVIALEDKRFYENVNGVDWKRTFGSAINMFIPIYSEESGGSTITQQLIKQLTGDDDKSPMRKIREIMRARYVSQNTPQEVILECYFNTVNFANGCYGIQTASEYYFGKSDLFTLTNAECAALAAIIKSPLNYDPIAYPEGNGTAEHPEGNKERREWCLYEMYDQGYISETDYNAALAEEIQFHRGDLTSHVVQRVNTYFVDAVIEDVISDFMTQYGYNEAYATNLFYSGGLQIDTTIDENIQNTIDKTWATKSNFPYSDVQSAMVVMDYEGHIKGLAGGRFEKTDNRAFNRATMAERQPGSTMKPIGAYGPALQRDAIYWSKIEKNQPIDNWDKGKKGPTNYGGVVGSGTVTVQKALEQSLNTVPVRIVQAITAEESFRFLTQNLRISTLVEREIASNGDILSDINLSSLALGGTTYGTTVREMTAAYATFGNLGKYYLPRTYTLVVDQMGRTLLPKDPELVKPVNAFTEDTANIMSRLLQTVVTGSQGTARDAAFGNWDILGKTGTTTDNNDRWFIGGTPYYVAACWVGYDTPKNLKNITNPCIKLWKAVMSSAHSGLPLKAFPDTDEVEYRRYCTVTGMPATVNCTSTATGWFKKSYAPPCTAHGGKLAAALSKPSSTPSTGTTSSKPAETTTSSAPPASTAPVSAPETLSSTAPPPESSAAQTSSAVSSSAASVSSAASLSETSNGGADGED